jgi:glutathione-regulated potassium-efflux system ancillary protein KefC/glutathione-regulated potassium-efflux system protein KefB
MVVTVSMMLAPLAFAAHERLLGRWIARHSEPEYDTIDGPGNPVIIAGYGRVGQIVSRILRMCDIPFTALDASYQQVDFVRRYGNKIYYGDASRFELLQAAKAGDARLFVLAIDDVEASVKTAELVRRHFPNLPILARARNRVHQFRLHDLGVKLIYRETFLSSLEMAHQALLRLGLGVATAQRAVALFKQHDEAQLEIQHAVHRDEEQLIQTTQQAANQLRELFETDIATFPRQNSEGLSQRAAGSRK